MLVAWKYSPTSPGELLARLMNPRGVDVAHPYDADFVRNAHVAPNLEPFADEQRYTVLQHEHYMTVFDVHRRVPIVSYANVDWYRRRTTPISETRNFTFDPLVPSANQWGSEAYQYDDYDRGHLTRRRSIAWGDDQEEAIAAQQQSDYYTNIVPQHSHFNRVVWASVEDACRQLGSRTRTGRSIEVTGSWFDESRQPTYDETNSIGKPEFRRVPDAYWKICIAGSATCFFVPHSDREATLGKGCDSTSACDPLRIKQPADFVLTLDELKRKIGYNIDKEWRTE